MGCSLDLDLNDEAHLAPTTVFSKEPRVDNVQYERPDYIQPLQQVKETSYAPNAAQRSFGQRDSVTSTAVDNYQELMTPANPIEQEESVFDEKMPIAISSNNFNENFFLTIEQGSYGVFKRNNSLHLLSLFALSYQINKNKIAKSWQDNDDKSTTKLISQPLLLPVLLTLSDSQMSIVIKYQSQLELAGLLCVIQNNNVKKQVQIRQFPALLRDKDVSSSFITIIDTLLSITENDSDDQKTNYDGDIISAIANAMNATDYSVEQAQMLWMTAKKELSDELIETVLLNSVPLDLTSEIKQLNANAKL